MKPGSTSDDLPRRPAQEQQGARRAEDDGEDGQGRERDDRLGVPARS